MTRFLIAAMALLASTAAPAAVITIDDFSTPQAVADTADDGVAVSSTSIYTVGGNSFARTLTVDQFEHADGDPSLASQGTIGFGTFAVSNDAQTNSRISLAYDINALTDDFIGSSDAFLHLTFADASAAVALTMVAFLNDTFLGSETFTGAGFFSLFLPQLNASNNELRLELSGGTSFDATLGPIAIETIGNTPVPVPAPGALGLVGGGFVTVALVRRRKRPA